MLIALAFRDARQKEIAMGFLLTALGGLPLIQARTPETFPLISLTRRSFLFEIPSLEIPPKKKELVLVV